MEVVNSFKLGGICVERQDLQSGNKISGGEWHKLIIRLQLRSERTNNNHYFNIIFWNEVAKKANFSINVGDWCEVEGVITTFENKGFHNPQFIAKTFNAIPMRDVAVPNLEQEMDDTVPF